MKRLFVNLAVLLLATIFIPVGASTATYSDSIFNDSDWTITTVELGNGGMVTASQSPMGGNPGEYRRIVNTVNGANPFPNSVIQGFHLKTSAVYDPSTQGAIDTIDYYEDSIMFVGFGQGQASEAALLQDGTLYRSTRRVLSNQLNSWTPQSILALTEQEFTDEADGTPDFSESGGMITFGFVRSNSTPGGGYFIDAGIDNWKIDVHPVPLPAGAWLFISGLLGLVWKSRNTS